jgi:hypothetical protein
MGSKENEDERGWRGDDCDVGCFLVVALAIFAAAMMVLR